jgi:hypothetical protein
MWGKLVVFIYPFLYLVINYFWVVQTVFINVVPFERPVKSLADAVGLGRIGWRAAILDVAVSDLFPEFLFNIFGTVVV